MSLIFLLSAIFPFPRPFLTFGTSVPSSGSASTSLAFLDFLETAFAFLGGKVSALALAPSASSSLPLREAGFGLFGGGAPASSSSASSFFLGRPRFFGAGLLGVALPWLSGWDYHET